VASPPPSKKGTLRRLRGMRLTENMVAKLEVAFFTVPAGKTTVAAYLRAPGTSPGASTATG